MMETLPSNIVNEIRQITITTMNEVISAISPEFGELFQKMLEYQDEIKLYEYLRSQNRSDFQNYVCEQKLMELKEAKRKLGLRFTVLLREQQRGKKGTLTHLDIQRAKEVPFSRLLEFNKYGFTVCPFHGDTKPSMKWYKEDNIVHCFGCGVHLDTIEYMKKRYNLSFKEAVLSLLRQS